MRDDICWVCGGEGANILCPSCGKIVCADCIDEESHKCLECIEEIVSGNLHKKKIMLVSGMVLLLIGLSTVAAGIVLALPTEGVTVVFPFMIGNVSLLIASTYTFLFFVTIAVASLLPWYIHSRAKPMNESSSDVSIIEGKTLGGEDFQHVEYMITTEIPKQLEKSILIETAGTNIILRSTIDKDFKRSYIIPQNHDLEDIDYDYEEGFLVLRLHLVLIP